MACEQRGRHVTRLFCRPCHVHHPPAFPFGRFNDPPFLFNFPTCHQFKFQRNIDDELRGPMAISPLQVGPLPRRELAPGHTPLSFNREVLRAPAF